MSVYYNEFDAYPAQWLRNLVAAGQLPDGTVDDRPIQDVRATTLAGYSAAHFFAGIGGWPLALQLAGWPSGVTTWTGSCPCQPFSKAGRGKGTADGRHLWPVWFQLIAECCPSVVFGEQVPTAVRHGWLDLVFADMEGAGYTCGAVVLPACAIGAPHQRERLWWAAYRDGVGRARIGRGGEAGTGERGGVDDAMRGRRESTQGTVCPGGDAAVGAGVGHAAGARLARRGVDQAASKGLPRAGSVADGSWRDVEWLPCRDGKARPTQPGLLPLAHGFPGRVGQLRAYGNAIVPQVAALFVRAVMHVLGLDEVARD